LSGIEIERGIGGTDLNRKFAYSLGILSMLVVLTISVAPTSAASYTTVGIVPGSSSVYSENISSTFPTTETKLVINIFTVSGTVVYENASHYLADGTVGRIDNMVVDVNKNSGSSYILMLTVIASGLTTGDPTTPGGLYKINDSSPMTFGGATRTINHFKGSTFDASKIYIEDWWDKDTGITVKWNFWFPGSPGYWQNVTMTSTTAWSPSAPPAPSTFSTTSMIAIAGIGIVALVIGFLVGRSGKRKR
jgi:hypothetical protein